MISLYPKANRTLIYLASTVFIICIASYSSFIFGKNLFLYMDIGADTATQYWPNLVNLIRIFQTDGFTLWIPNLGLGSSIFTSPPLLTDPFNSFLFFLSPGAASSGLIYTHILKHFLAAFVGYLLLKERGSNNFSALIGAVILAFSGFIVLWGQHYFFGTAYILNLLLLLALERSLFKGRQLLLYVTVATFLIFSIYFVYTSIFCGAAYLLFNLKRLTNVSTKNWWLSLASVAAGIGLSAFWWLPSLETLRASPRVTLSSLDQIFSLSDLRISVSYFSRILSNNIYGTATEYTGPLNYYEAPQLFPGSLTIALIFSAFFTKKWRYSCLTFLLVFIAVCSTNIIPVSANGFVNPGYRWTFIPIILAVIGATHVLTHHISTGGAEIKTVQIFISLISFCGAIFLFSFYTNLILNKQELIRSFISVSAFIVLGTAFKRKWLSQNLLAILLAFFTIADLQKSTWDTTVRGRSIVTSIGPHHDSSAQLIAEVRSNAQKIEHTVYYRIQRDFYKTYTEPLEWNFLGLATYASVSEASLLEFSRFASIPHPHDWTSLFQGPRSERHELLNMLGTKYYISTNNSAPPEGFKLVIKSENALIFKNTQPNSLAWVYSRIVSVNDFYALRNCIGDQAFLTFLPLDTERTNESTHVTCAQAKQITKSAIPTNIESYKKDQISVQLNDDVIHPRSAIQLSIPFNKGWSLQVNGEDRSVFKSANGMITAMLRPGDRDLQFRYFPHKMRFGLWIGAFSLFFILGLWQFGKRDATK